MLKEAQSGQGLVIGSRFPVKAQTRPPRQKFFQVHPDPAYTVDNVYVIEYEGEFYYVAPIPELILHVEAYVKQYRLHTAVTKNGTVFLWLCVLPTDNPLQRTWALSRLGVAEGAMKDWVRPKADQEAGGYQVDVAPGHLGTPNWPSLTLQELVNKAFKDKLITHTDHAVIRELDGRQ